MERHITEASLDNQAIERTRVSLRAFSGGYFVFSEEYTYSLGREIPAFTVSRENVLFPLNNTKLFEFSTFSVNIPR